MIQLDCVERDFVRISDKKTVRIRALHNVTLRVKKGEFVLITGPSGAGKTTLLNLIAGVDRPTKGEIKVSGNPLHTMAEKELSIFRNKVIGYNLSGLQTYSPMGFLHQRVIMRNHYSGQIFSLIKLHKQVNQL